MSEQDLQKKIIKHLESKNYYVIKVIVSNRNGTPDILFMKDGHFCAIEVKAPGKMNTVTELQKYHLDLINKSGGKALAADSVEQVKQFFS